VNIIRTTNPNGTYRYEIDGELQIAASRVFYTHVSTYSNGAVKFHRTESAALRAKGEAGWVKTGYVAIADADPFPAPADITWDEVPGEALAKDQFGRMLIHITVDGAGNWNWAVSRREVLAHGNHVPDLETAKAQALDALAAL
jgi:hypothetical protein